MAVFRFYTLDSKGVRHPAVEAICDTDAEARAHASRLPILPGSVIEVWSGNELIHRHPDHSNLIDQTRNEN